MRNLWIQTEYPVATWVANLTTMAARPRALLDVVAEMLSAGERHRVFLPVDLPELDFRGDHSGDLAKRLVTQWREHSIVNAFGFTGAALAPGVPGSSTVEAEVAWFDRNDAIVVARTADLGAVLRSLEPVPGAIGDAFTMPFPPLRITGPRLPYHGQPLKLAESHASGRIEIHIALHSNIWFPFIFGSAHPLADFRRQFDNRTLANLHTPRLNNFLRDIASVVSDAGGSWTVDIDDTTAEAHRWLDACGIHLDAAPPALFPPDALAEDWY